MKKIFSLSAVVTILTLLSINNAYAAYSSNGYIDKYDSSTGLYYKSIKDYKRDEKKEKSFLSSIKSLKSSRNLRNIINISIYNPETEEIKYIFNDDKIRKITKILFENSIDKEKNSINFAGSFAGLLKNNNNIKNRNLKNTIILSDTNNEDNTETIWIANKDGSGLKEITTIDAKESNWHVDVKNSKIRIVSEKEGEITIKNFDWN